MPIIQSSNLKSSDRQINLELFIYVDILKATTTGTESPKVRTCLSIRIKSQRNYDVELLRERRKADIISVGGKSRNFFLPPSHALLLAMAERERRRRQKRDEVKSWPASFDDCHSVCRGLATFRGERGREVDLRSLALRDGASQQFQRFIG